MGPTFPQTVIKSLIADALGKYRSSFTHPALVDAAKIRRLEPRIQIQEDFS